MRELRNPEAKAGAAQIAQLLDESRIPNVLFGWTALALTGADFGSGDVEFVVPDEKLASAILTISAAGHAICTDPDCQQLDEFRTNPHGISRSSSSSSRDDADDADDADDSNDNGSGALPSGRDTTIKLHAVPDSHFHLPPGDTLALYQKSRLSWRFPTIPLGPPAPDDSISILSTNAARLPPRGTESWPGIPEFAPLFLPGYTPSGPWHDLYPVKVLSARAHTEALIACLARDLCLGCNVDFLWFFMLNYLGEKKVNEERWMDRYVLADERFQRA
ncbi:hypothetical protein BJY00DRAFT_310750 [Aspergillus carlsbadensis]|nr:hypothetical protein BJY00DRAFT_310750 [Aspergillus carlsbadensis]